MDNSRVVLIKNKTRELFFLKYKRCFKRLEAVKEERVSIITDNDFREKPCLDNQIEEPYTERIIDDGFVKSHFRSLREYFWERPLKNHKKGVVYGLRKDV